MGRAAHKLFDLGAIACFAGLTGVVVWFAVCALGPKLGLVDGHFALETLTFVWGAAFAAGTLAVALASGVLLVLIRRNDREHPKGTGFVLAAIVVSIALLIASLAGGFSYARHPGIHEVTTDLDNPPEFSAGLILRRGMDANTVAAAGMPPAESRIEPLYFDASPDAVYAAALTVARDQRWRVGTTARSRGMIEFTVESFWYAQTDDCVIRISDDGQGRARLDYRSAARFGERDGGRNARRLIQLEPLIRSELD